MYTVGEVAKCLGISRDTLKFYEKKNLINPKQEENGYRKYNIIDINEVVTINFYRDIDIEIKQIQEIRKADNVDIIESILDEKKKKLEEEIKYKKLLLERIEDIKADYKSMEENLDKFSIREMKPIVITNEIIMKEDINQMYSEILEKYDYSNRIKKAVNLSGLSRMLYFNSKGVLSEKYIFYEKVDKVINEKRKIISYPKCIYTVLAVPIINQENNIDDDMIAYTMEFAKELGYKILGITFINLLFNGYKNGENIQYLEVYIPVT